MRYLAFVLFLLVPILGVYTFVKADDWGLWFPEHVSTIGPGVDGLFNLILIPVTITFLGTELVLAWSLFKFSSPRLAGKSVFTHGSHKLEMVWTAIPAILLVVIAFAQLGQWADIRFESGFKEDLEESETTLDWYPYAKGGLQGDLPVFAEVWASQFDWRIVYPDETGDLHGVDRLEVPFEFVVPVDTKVIFHLRSRDVLHSFFVPEFRLKQDAVPGMTIPVWFQAEKAGTYDLICAELCGWGHYKMAGSVKVLPKDEFKTWLEAKRAEYYSGGAGE
jgi:cytochrome c oxidase subunit 2